MKETFNEIKVCVCVRDQIDLGVCIYVCIYVCICEWLTLSCSI